MCPKGFLKKVQFRAVQSFSTVCHSRERLKINVFWLFFFNWREQNIQKLLILAFEVWTMHFPNNGALCFLHGNQNIIRFFLRQNYNFLKIVCNGWYKWKTVYFSSTIHIISCCKKTKTKNREIERNLSFFFQRDTLYQCRVYDDRDRVVNGTKPLVTEIEIPVYVAEKFSDTCSEAPADGIQWPRTKKVLVLQDSDVDCRSI